MSDGMIGNSHVTIPDLLEPVVGFRTFIVKGGRAASKAYDEITWVNNPNGEPFKEPPCYVVDPISGKLIKDYNTVSKAFKKWQNSLGEQKVIHHPARPATRGTIVSPNKGDFEWKPGVNKASCTGSIFVNSGLNYIEQSPHGVPNPNCSCGFYSYYTGFGMAEGGSTVMGIVTQWGQIEAHSTGMRSEFMQIEALYGGEILNTLGDEWDDVIKFSIGEVSRKEFAALATEFGSPLPYMMRPKDEERLYHSPPVLTSSSMKGSLWENLLFDRVIFLYAVLAAWLTLLIGNTLVSYFDAPPQTSTPATDTLRVDFKGPLSPPTNFLYGGTR